MTKRKRIKHKLDIDAAKSGCSWGSAFAAAASVQLEDLDEEFLERTQSTDTPLADIARLAAISKGRTLESGKDERKSSKLEEPVASVEADDEITKSATTILEGRMVIHPRKKDEQFMILIDKKTGLVFDALRQIEDGNYRRVGKIGKKDKIEWEEEAFDAIAKDNEERKSFPFPTDPDDHCESPLESYQDIVPLLRRLFPEEDTCKIYDPYYCDGAVKRNLATLGFSQVYNENEDCYRVWSSGTSPSFGVLITNPPYSEEHIPKLVEFLSSPTMTNKPWFLLMPQWVTKKPYFVDQWDKKALFLVPKKRYIYLPPKDFREKKASDVHKKSSPFVSIWYVWGGSIEKTNMLHDYYRNDHGHYGSCLLARSKNGLRDLRRKKRKR